MKIYTESKAAACTLQLVLIKRYTLPKRYSQRYKLKS